MVWRVEIDNGTPLNFHGIILASVVTEVKPLDWLEFRLWRTGKPNKEEGLYIYNGYACYAERRSVVGRPRCCGMVCSSLAEVLEFFGNGGLAQRLYEKSGLIENTPTY